MERIRLGIVGYGQMGKRVYEELSGSAKYEVTAVCDRYTDRLELLPEYVARYSIAEKLFADEEVDVVLIAANNSEHKDLIIHAAKAGKDIICEPPTVLNLQELNEIMAVVEECGVNFTVHFTHREDPDFQTLQEICYSEKLGRVYLIRSSKHCSQGYLTDWHRYASEGGGILMSTGVYLLDQILYMLPGFRITSVYAEMRSILNKEVDDYCSVILHMEDDLRVEVEAGTVLLTDQSSREGEERKWYIAGKKGCAYLEGKEPTGKVLLFNGSRRDAQEDKKGLSSVKKDKVILTEEIPEIRMEHETFFNNYWKAYDGQEEFMVRVSEIVRGQKLLEAIRLSAETNSVIELE